MDIEEWVSTLGPKIKKLRTDAGMTQAELAEKSGVSQSAIAKIEKSHHAVTLAAFLSLADALEVSAKDLMSGYSDQGKRLKEIETKTDWQLLSDRVGELKPSMRSYVIELFGKLLDAKWK